MLSRLAALTLVLALLACNREASAPSSEQNEQLDSAESMLNAAPNELESVGEELSNRH